MMVKTTLAIVAGLLAAIPIAWQWSKARQQKRAVKDFEKRKQDIRKAVDTNDIAAIKRTLGKWL